MKILIINAYSKSHLKAFKQFEKNLKQVNSPQNPNDSFPKDFSRPKGAFRHRN